MVVGTDGLRNKNAQVLISDFPTILFLDDDLIWSQFLNSDLIVSDNPGSRPSSYHALAQRHFATNNGPRNAVGTTTALYGYLFGWHTYQVLLVRVSPSTRARHRSTINVRPSTGPRHFNIASTTHSFSSGHQDSLYILYHA